MTDLRASDSAERGVSPEQAIAPGDTRWAIYDRPTRTLWFGGPATKTHLTVAEESGLLRNDSDYYRPGPSAKMCGGYIVRSADGAWRLAEHHAVGSMMRQAAPARG